MTNEYLGNGLKLRENSGLERAIFSTDNNKAKLSKFALFHHSEISPSFNRHARLAI